MICTIRLVCVLARHVVDLALDADPAGPIIVAWSAMVEQRLLLTLTIRFRQLLLGDSLDDTRLQVDVLFRLEVGRHFGLGVEWRLSLQYAKEYTDLYLNAMLGARTT